MALVFGSNIQVLNMLPNFTRDHITDLEHVNYAYYDDGHPVYCEADRQHYKIVKDFDIDPSGKTGHLELLTSLSKLDSYKTDDVSLPQFNKLVILTQEEYDSLQGEEPNTLYYIPRGSHLINGAKGESAYEIWLKVNNYNSNEHSEQEFLESLQAIPHEWIGDKQEFQALTSLESNTTYYITV